MPQQINDFRFNPRAPAGRDFAIVNFTINYVEFQSTRPRGARREFGAKPLVVQRFNPRAPAGRDIQPTGTLPLLEGFNPRAPAGRDKAEAADIKIKGSFNPRAPAGRDDILDGEIASFEVSIHAPPRGATCGICHQSSYRQSFNPRAPAGRDDLLEKQRTAWTGFNPRAPAGRDHRDARQ